MMRYSVTPGLFVVVSHGWARGGGARVGRGEGEGLTGVDDVHGAHGAAGVVEDPLLVQVDMVGEGRVAVQLGDDVGRDAAGVVAVGGDGALGQVV